MTDKPLEWCVTYDGHNYFYSSTGNRYNGPPHVGWLEVDEIQRLMAEDQVYLNLTHFEISEVPWGLVNDGVVAPPRRIVMPDTNGIHFKSLFILSNGEASFSVVPKLRCVAVYNKKGILRRYRSERDTWVHIGRKEVENSELLPPPTPYTEPEPIITGSVITHSDVEGLQGKSDFRQRWNAEWREFMQQTSFQIRSPKADAEQAERGRVAQVAAEIERKSGVRLLRPYQAEVLTKFP